MPPCSPPPRRACAAPPPALPAASPVQRVDTPAEAPPALELASYTAFRAAQTRPARSARATRVPQGQRSARCARGPGPVQACGPQPASTDLIPGGESILGGRPAESSLGRPNCVGGCFRCTRTTQGGRGRIFACQTNHLLQDSVGSPEGPGSCGAIRAATWSIVL